MRIAFVTNSLSREGGGLFHSVRMLARTIESEGHDVSVFAPSDCTVERDRSYWGEIHTCPYPVRFPSRAATELSRCAPDIIHLNGIWLPHSRVVYAFSRSSGVPVVISPRGMLDLWALRNARLKKRLAAWLYENRNLRNAASIHALCDSEFHSIRAFGLKQPVAVIPNGVGLPAPMTERPGLAWPFPERWRTHPVLLFLSRVHPKKGLVPLIQAWRRIAFAGTDWRLAIVGPDENGHAKELLALVEDYGLGSSAAWLGARYGQERDACYHHAAAFILPSYSEGLPMAALEAFGFGLPAVLTPACHLPEAFDAGAALLCEATEDGIAGSLRHLFQLESSHLAAMGRRGRQLVTTSFTWPSIARRMISVYEWMAASKACPPPADVRIV